MTRLRNPDLARNPISWVGSTAVTTAAVLFIVLFALEFLGYLTSPYVRLPVPVTLPLALVVGPLLIPGGMCWLSPPSADRHQKDR